MHNKSECLKILLFWVYLPTLKFQKPVTKLFYGIEKQNRGEHAWWMTLQCIVMHYNIHAHTIIYIMLLFFVQSIYDKNISIAWYAQCPSHRVPHARTQSTFDNVRTSNVRIYNTYVTDKVWNRSLFNVRYSVQSLCENCTMLGFSGKSRKMYLYIVRAQCTMTKSQRAHCTTRFYHRQKNLYTGNRIFS